MRSPTAPPRAGLSKAVVWASSLAAGLALIAGVAAAALYDHARETSLLAAKSEETRSLAQTVKTLKDRIDAIEAARAHDESADMRKIAAELKGESAGVRDLSANLGQTNARIDKLERDHGARLDKLADRFDHETAGKLADLSGKLADLSGRLDKLEKRPVAAAARRAGAAGQARSGRRRRLQRDDRLDRSAETARLLAGRRRRRLCGDRRPRRTAAGRPWRRRAWNRPGAADRAARPRLGGGDQRRRHRRRSAGLLTRAAHPHHDVDSGDLAAGSAAAAIAPSRCRDRGCRPARPFPR